MDTDDLMFDRLADLVLACRVREEYHHHHADDGGPAALPLLSAHVLMHEGFFAGFFPGDALVDLSEEMLWGLKPAWVYLAPGRAAA